MPDIHLGLSFHPFLLLVAFLVAVGLTFFTYRQTIPPIPTPLRLVLATLRAVSLFLLALVLGEPLLSLLTRRVEPPTTVVLIDNSQSMSIKDRLGDRKEILHRILESKAIQDLSRIGATRFATFDSRLRLLESLSRDSITATGDATDLPGALNSLKELASTQNLQSVVLITDGNSTTDANPLFDATQLGLPLFVVGVGDTSEQRDLLIRKVLTNSITYVGNRLPVHATVKSTGFTDQRVEVTLSDEKGVVDRKTLSLQGGTREYTVPLGYVPETEGMQKLSVAVTPLEGELTKQNNRFVTFTRVLKSKMKVLLLGGAPSSDVAFIRRALEQDPHIDATSRIQRADGEMYEGTLTPELLAEAECLILVGFPTTATTAQTLAAVIRALDEGKGILLVMSRSISFPKVRQLEPFLPVSIRDGSTDEFSAFVSIQEPYALHPIVKLAGPASSLDQWSKLPPLFKLQAQFVAKPESEVLARTRIQTTTLNDPMLVSRSVNRRKSLMLLGYGLWRWKMLAEQPLQPTVFEEFLSNSVRWLTTREDEQQIRVRTSKQVYSGLEPIEFVGQVYDDTYRPIDNARVEVSVRPVLPGGQGARVLEILLDPLGSGQYEGSLEGLEEGDYRFNARVSLNGKPLAAENGSFAVGGVHLEFTETRMNKPLLEQLAARTGGRYYDPSSIQTLPQDIASLPEFQPRELTHTSEIPLWSSPWMLALIASFFALEWFLRKRNGLL